MYADVYIWLNFLGFDIAWFQLTCAVGSDTGTATHEPCDSGKAF